MNPYLGHENQLYGFEEVRLVGGKGDGMRLLQVRNGSGLEFTIALDRAADLYRVSLDAVNLGYFSPCGFVAPAYFDRVGNGFLDSFTAGFFTTCGLGNVGNACVDEGEQLGQHGTIGNIPAEHVNYYIEDDVMHIKARIRDAVLFGHKYLLEREYIAPLFENKISVKDKITNIGSAKAPIQMLYHCNIGYPLLSEDAIVEIPSKKVIPAGEYAAAQLDTHLKMLKPTRGYGETCYFHEFEGQARISVYNPKIQKGVVMSYDSAELPKFCQWKAMGEHEYALGIEPGICIPKPRNRVRADGELIFLQPGEVKTQTLNFEFVR